MAPLVPQRLNIPIGGGLLQNETPEYLDPPALYECENMYHKDRTGLTKRPGYNRNQICVDGRKATVPSWLASVNTPLITVQPDRFLITESGVTFAARGFLWSYMGNLFGGCTDVTPQPNTVKHCEVPDLKIVAETTFGVADTNVMSGVQVIDAASSSHATDLDCSTYLLYTIGGQYEWCVRLTQKSTGNLVIGETLGITNETWGHVCCAAYPEGFIVTCFNVTESKIMCFRYTIQSAKFTEVVFPALKLHDPQGFYGDVAYAPSWYDICGTASNDIHVAWVVATGQFTNNIHSYPDVSYGSFANGLFAGTFDARTLQDVGGPAAALKYGGYYMGEGAVYQTGCLTYSPTFSVAGDENGNYAVAWINQTTGNVGIRAALQQTPWAAAVILDNVTTRGKQVGIGFVKPTKQVDVMWTVVWEYTDLNLIAGGNYLTSVKSQAVGVSGALDYETRYYWASHVISNPWCSIGNSYAVMAPSQPLNANGDQPSGASYADQPYVLARIWQDQDTNDTDAATKNYQYPMGVWGYGQVVQPQQPWRVLWDPKTSDSANKVIGVGSIVLADPFARGKGVSVQSLTFDPRSPDRYSSADLPGGGSIFGCANPWIFDGDRAFEAAFVQRPWFISYAAASGGNLTDDSTVDGAAHYLQLIYEHEDAKGRITRSPVSTMVSVVVSGTGKKITLTVIPPFWSARKPHTTVLKIYMCRDAVSFQLVGTVPVVVWQLGGLPDYLSFQIGTEPNPEAPFIYTYDGTIESGYAPFAAHVKRWDNRIWLANQNKISYSQEFIDGEGPSFPDTFTEYVDTPVSGMLPFDDRLILFHLDAIAYRNGEGPRENGEGGNYSKWNYFTHEVGCINSRSLVRTQIGAFFQSRRHIEFLDTSCKITHQLAIEDVFSGVSDMTSGQVVLGGLSLPKLHQVRLLYCDRSSGTLKQLVIDYETMTWSRWYGAYSWWAYYLTFFGDICVDGDQVYILDGNGNLLSEVEYFFTDADMPVDAVATRRHINWSVKTPWIKIDGLQGVQMVWNTQLMLRVAAHSPSSLGGLIPNFGITVNVDVDYQNNLEPHGSKTIVELNELREPNDLTYLQVGHVNPICSAYQIQLSSSDSTSYGYTFSPTGVYGIVGIWSELGVEQGTGRKRAESRM
jgi:hypothetical protein